MIAELMAVGLALVGVGAARRWPGRPWALAAVGVALVAWTSGAMGVRDASVGMGAAVTPPESLPGWAALVHAGAVRVAALGWLGVAGMALAGRRPRATVVAFAAVAVALASEWRMYTAIASGALGSVDGWAAARALAVVVAVGATSAGLVRRRAAGGLAGLLGLGLAVGSARASLAWGPPPEAGDLVVPLPPDPGGDAGRAIPRPLGGCLVSVVPITVGRPARTAGFVACPDGPAKRGFAPTAIPIVAADPATPAEVLTGWHVDDAGAVAVWTSLGAGASARAWRVGQRRIEVWSNPASARVRPLPGSVVVWEEGGHVRIAGPGGVADPAADDPIAAVAAAVSGRARVDVLVHESLAPTLGDVVGRFAALGGAVPGGHCALVTGPVEPWVALVGRPLPTPPPAPTVIEEGVLEGDEPFE